MIRLIQKFTLILLFLFSYIYEGKTQSVVSNWSKGTAPRLRTINGVKVVSANNIIIIGGNETNDSITSLFRSTDRGITWDNLVDMPFSAWLRSISFPNASVGYVVGWAGKIYKTLDGGANWSLLHATGVAGNRHFNGVYFVDSNIGYIVGGNKSGDSIQTILKTNDGGVNWSVQRDNLGSWLNSIYFTDSNTGFAVGDNGTLLKTTNGGLNWNAITITGGVGTRNYKKIYFTSNAVGFIVGGNPQNDSIRTILKTMDAGLTWNVILDEINPMLNDLDFSNTSSAISVGNNGVALFSLNSGETWTTLNIPDSINDNRDIFAVDFLNSDFGIVAGVAGKLLIYNNNLPISPTCITEDAVKYLDGHVKINGAVNANSSATSVAFEYGTSLSLGTSVSASSNNLTSNTLEQVSATIHGLSSGMYYFRVKATNSGGTNFGDIHQFYIGHGDIPNFDFELWITDTINKLNDWNIIGTIEQGVSYDDSKSVILKSDNGENTSAILSGIIGDQGPQGGVPFSFHADSLICNFKHSLKTGFNALVLLFFKKEGNIISQNFYTLQDSTHGEFVRYAFPISYSNDSIVPDTLIVGFANNNPFAGTEDPSNILEIDNLSFLGTNQNVPDPGFENWFSEIKEYPVSWYINNRDNTIDVPEIIKTTDSRINQFAIKLKGNAISGKPAYISTLFNGESKPAFPVLAKHLTLNGYHKFYKHANDTAFILVTMFKNNHSIGVGELKLVNSDTGYVPFVIPINYFNNDTPDSANIEIGTNLRSPNNNSSNSELWVDALSFDILLDSAMTILSVNNDINRILNIKVFPNPTNGFLKLNLPNDEVIDEAYIIDMKGARQDIARFIRNDNYEFDLSQLNNGVYILFINTNENIYFSKVILSKN